jgi:transcription factor IIIB subunit 2
VATDAVRLVQRFDRDWMTRGRRPAGICGAALLLAARMNNFRRSVEEIVQVVKIADTTLKKRLDEFKATPSGNLTLADFRNVWLEEEMDPPAFTKGREKEEAEREAVEQGCAESTVNGKKKARKKRKGKRKREESDEELETQESVQPELPPVDTSLLNQGILAGTTGGPLFEPDPELEDDEYSNIDPALLQPTAVLSAAPSTSTPPASTLIEETASSVLAGEVSTFLENSQGTLLTEALDEAEERRLAQISVVDELLGLDEAELDRFILSEDEVRIKERVWVELNKEYLEALAGESFSVSEF